VSSFTIMTGPSAGKLSDCHTRAPVILEPDEWGQWLDPSQNAMTLLSADAVRPERFEVHAA
jgi:putative SOS response-associated peptidase YedK